jgi:hypothetical protein
VGGGKIGNQGSKGN